jgi:hypothetical protein
MYPIYQERKISCTFSAFNLQCEFSMFGTVFVSGSRSEKLLLLFEGQISNRFGAPEKS